MRLYNVRVTARLKSGHLISAKCVDFQVGTTGNEVTRISIIRDDGNWPNYIRLDEITMIHTKPLIWFRLRNLWPF